MMKVTLRKSLVLALGAMVLGACQPAPDQAEEVVVEGTVDEAVDGAAQGEMPDAPDAQPTASIFGPEAGLPEPEEDAEAALEPLKVTIGFPDGGAELDADAVAALEKALGSDQLRAASLITLRSHSDVGGSAEANLEASEKRGLAVAAWLIERGISEDRIEVIAFGAQNPTKPNALPDGSPNELGRAANRRVELLASAPKAKPKAPDKDAEAK